MSITIEMIKEVMSDYKEANIKEITEKIINAYPNLQETEEVIYKKITTKLYLQTKKKGSDFKKVKNKKGGYKKGVYRLIKRKKVEIKSKTTIEISPQIDRQYTGCAGEHAVLSELLFWEYNASMMTVDDGIDIVASKKGNYFHIQVKTANMNITNSYSFSIRSTSFESKHKSTTFYVLVLRRKDDCKYFNDYIILPSSYIDILKDKGIIESKKSISLNVTIRNGLHMLNGKEDVTFLVNKWSKIQ